MVYISAVPCVLRSLEVGGQKSGSKRACSVLQDSGPSKAGLQSSKAKIVGLKSSHDDSTYFKAPGSTFHTVI